jgi:hypothetical protein
MTTRTPIINYEENNQWCSEALRACLIHDHMMDGFRVKFGLNLEDGTRATHRAVGDGIKELAKQYKGKENELPLEKFITKWYVGFDI